jgi:hypothetical protein
MVATLQRPPPDSPSITSGLHSWLRQPASMTRNHVRPDFGKQDDKEDRAGIPSVSSLYCIMMRGGDLLSEPTHAA